MTGERKREEAQLYGWALEYGAGQRNRTSDALLTRQPFCH